MTILFLALATVLFFQQLQLRELRRKLDLISDTAASLLEVPADE